MSTTAGFAANAYFDYGLYVDGTAIGIGDTTTMRYVQNAQNTCAVSWNGYSLGTNGMMPYSPLTVPVSLGSSASNLQIGIKNSSAALNVVASYAPSATVSTTVTTVGSNYYTVPATAGGLAVVGVYCYLWGAGGGYAGKSGYGNENGAGGGGGYVSGYYSCSPATNLLYVVADWDGTRITAYGGAGSAGGGFSGLFLSNAGALVQSNAIAIAGGGGGAWYNPGYGGGGGYPSGGSGYSAGTPGTAGSTGGSQTAAGGTAGALVAGTNNGSSAGWYGGAGGGNDSGPAGAGGSSYVGNILGASPSPAGIGLTAAASYSNGVGLTSSAQFPATNAFAGGNTSPYYIAGKGVGTGTPGLVVLVPAVGTSPVYVGVQAAMVC